MAEKQVRGKDGTHGGDGRKREKRGQKIREKRDGDDMR